MELATSIGVNLTGMPGKSGNTSRVESGAVGIADLTKELDEKAQEYIDLIHKADALIGKLKSENFRKLLTLYYMTRCSWKTIRDEMGYKDEKSVYRCHDYALRELQKLM